MASNIFDNEMFSVNVTPWHKQGTVLQGNPTTEEAIVAAKLDWRVITGKAVIQGTDSVIPGIQVTMRENWVNPDKKENPDGLSENLVLGVVKGDYQVLQNKEAFKVFDEVLLPAGYKYETAGAVHRGKKVWIMAKKPDVATVGDEKIQDYLLLVTSHDGSRALSVMPTSIRVVCNNTLTYALGKDGGSGFAIRHSGDVQNKLQNVMEAVKYCEGQFNKAHDMFTDMMNFKMQPIEVVAFWDAVQPQLKKRDEELKKNVWKTMAQDLKRLYVSGHGNRGQSLWDAYNALTEYVDFTRKTMDYRVLEYSQFTSGALLKQRAFDIASDIINHGFQEWTNSVN